MSYFAIYISLGFITFLASSIAVIFDDSEDTNDLGFDLFLGLFLVCVVFWWFVLGAALIHIFGHLTDRFRYPERFKDSNFWLNCNKKLMKDGNDRFYFEFQMKPKSDDWMAFKFLGDEAKPIIPFRAELKFDDRENAEKALQIFLDHHQKVVNETQSETVEYWAGSISSTEAQKIVDEFENNHNIKS